MRRIQQGHTHTHWNTQPVTCETTQDRSLTCRCKHILRPRRLSTTSVVSVPSCFRMRLDFLHGDISSASISVLLVRLWTVTDRLPPSHSSPSTSLIPPSGHDSYYTVTSLNMRYHFYTKPSFQNSKKKPCIQPFSIITKSLIKKKTTIGPHCVSFYLFGSRCIGWTRKTLLKLKACKWCGGVCTCVCAATGLNTPTSYANERI